MDLLRRPVVQVTVPPSVTLPEALAFFRRAHSMSFIVFDGEIEAVLPQWLSDNNWRLIESAPLRASFEELSERAAHMRKTQEKIWEVVKTTYEVAGVTVLIDREMVVGTLHGELAALCRTTGCSKVISAVWERVSRSLLVDEIDANGAKRRSNWVGGVCHVAVDPWPHVKGNDSDEILEVLRGAGLPVDAIFGRELEATVMLLEES